jgi:hypothetical protein
MFLLVFLMTSMVWESRTEEMAMRGLPVLRSSMRLVSFQLGTLAFASLIVALVSCRDRIVLAMSCAKPCRMPEPLLCLLRRSPRRRGGRGALHVPTHRICNTGVAVF